MHVRTRADGTRWREGVTTHPTTVTNGDEVCAAARGVPAAKVSRPSEEKSQARNSVRVACVWSSTLVFPPTVALRGRAKSGGWHTRAGATLRRGAITYRRRETAGSSERAEGEADGPILFRGLKGALMKGASREARHRDAPEGDGGHCFQQRGWPRGATTELGMANKNSLLPRWSLVTLILHYTIYRPRSRPLGGISGIMAAPARYSRATIMTSLPSSPP